MDPPRCVPGLVAVDGPLGAGKTPFCQSLVSALSEHHGPTALTKAVSPTALGDFLREAQFTFSGLPLAYIAAADRYLQVETVVLPAIHKKSFVVVDRYVLTAVALDGFGAGEDPERIMSIYSRVPIPMQVFLVLSPLKYRIDRLRIKGLLTMYDNWFLRLEEEEHCYQRAAAFLRGRGWTIEVLEQPLESFGVASYLDLAAGLADNAAKQHLLGNS